MLWKSWGIFQFQFIQSQWKNWRTKLLEIYRRFFNFKIKKLANEAVFSTSVLNKFNKLSTTAELFSLYFCFFFFDLTSLLSFFFSFSLSSSIISCGENIIKLVCQNWPRQTLWANNSIGDLKHLIDLHQSNQHFGH